MHPATRTVVDALAAANATGQVLELDQRAATAAAAAAALDCEVGAIANSLVFVAETAHGAAVAREPLLVLASGAHRVDTDLVARLVRAERLRRADPEFVRQHTGQSIGGVAPVGHPTRLRTVVDVDLAGYPVVWAAAGHPHAVFATTFDELVRLTGGTPAQVAAGRPVDPRGRSAG